MRSFSVAVSADSIKKAVYIFIGVVIFIVAQIYIDIPGIDIPDIKDIPEWMEAMHHL